MKKTFYYLLSLIVSSPLFAEAVSTTSENHTSNTAFLYSFGIAGVALAASVGAYSQSQAAQKALDGIARNPAASEKIFTPLLLSLALMESLVILAIVAIFVVKMG